MVFARLFYQLSRALQALNYIKLRQNYTKITHFFTLTPLWPSFSRNH